MNDMIPNDIHIHFFKTDTQGFDHNVLVGASNLFLEHRVSTLTTEFSMKTLKLANSSLDEMVETLTVAYRMICFDSRPESGVRANHPPDHVGYMQSVVEAAKAFEKDPNGW